VRLGKLSTPKHPVVSATLAVMLGALTACGDSAGREPVTEGGVSGSSTPVPSLTSSQWDALCRRFRDTSDYSILAECVGSATTAECESCIDSFQGPDDTPCSDRIGEVGSYPASCDWTVEELDACFDERERRLETWSCDSLRPEGLGDDGNCLYQFRQVCVPESV
jgi:hypothetical protein